MWQGEVVSINVGSGAAGDGGSITPVDEALLVAAQGIEGDRYFGKAVPARALSLIEAEAIEALAAEEGIELDYGAARRQVVTRDVPLNHLVGREFQIGDVRLRGSELNEPCEHLEECTQPGVRAGLQHRAGLLAEILTDGVIRPGDRICPA